MKKKIWSNIRDIRTKTKRKKICYDNSILYIRHLLIIYITLDNNIIISYITRTRNDRLARLYGTTQHVLRPTLLRLLLKSSRETRCARTPIWPIILSTLLRRINLPRSPPPTSCTIDIDMLITPLLSSLYRRRSLHVTPLCLIVIMLH